MSSISDKSIFGFNAGTAVLESVAASEETGGASSASGEAGTSEARPAGAQVSDAAVAPQAGETTPQTVAEVEDPVATGRIAMSAYATPAANPSSSDAEADKGGSFLSSLFANSKPKTPIPNMEAGKSRRVLLKTDGTPQEPTALAALPGVDPSSLFEIGQRASADEDVLEYDTYQVAAATGMARLAPNGLLHQRADVRTDCFGTDLIRLIRTVEHRFGERAVVTSGYRSPEHNARVNGAKRSMHMSCKAADIILPGVNMREVARYVRNLPGRGGVGTYCHTNAIHIDTGRKRDWNWSCRG